MKIFYFNKRFLATTLNSIGFIYKYQIRSEKWEKLATSIFYFLFFIFHFIFDHNIEVRLIRIWPHWWGSITYQDMAQTTITLRPKRKLKWTSPKNGPNQIGPILFLVLFLINIGDVCFYFVLLWNNFINFLILYVRIMFYKQCEC